MRRLTDSIRRAWMCIRQERGKAITRGLVLGVVGGAIAGAATGNWGLIAWLGVGLFVADVGWTYVDHLLTCLQGLDCEWESDICTVMWLVGGVNIGLAQRNGLSTYRTWGLRCQLTSPTGVAAVREGDRNLYTFSTMFPELTPKAPGRYEVAWFVKTKRGRWLSLLRDHFSINEQGSPVGIRGAPPED